MSTRPNSLADGLKLPRGLYLLRQWTGLQLGEKVLMLDADWPAVSSASSKRAALPPSPPIVSAAPLRDTRAAPEYHEEPAGVSAPDVAAGEGAEILVMARRYSDGASAASRAPWDGVALVDSTGTVIADLATQGRRSGAYDAWAACLVRLTPGTYELHYPLGDGTPVAQALIAPKGGWRLEAYLLDRAQDDDVAPARSLLMRPIGTAWGGPDDLWLQKAIISLGAERPGVSEPLAERLLGPAASSLARLVGAHLLLLSARSAPDGAKLLARFDEAVASLQGLLGEAHPDVVALASACADPALRKDGPATTPPMFERSWRLLVDAAQRGRPDLIPPDLWMRVRVTMALPPYFAWSADNSLQKNWHVAAREKLFAPAISTISGLESKAVWRGSANAINRRLRFLDFPPAALAEFKR